MFFEKNGAWVLMPQKPKKERLINLKMMEVCDSLCPGGLCCVVLVVLVV